MKIALIGAGIMGTGIAEVCIEAGLSVRLCSRRRESLDGALERIQTNQA
ncbi:MAG: 3-hydroxyacyl-CoA dehydrogenase NAD-binding domain-containing protein [Candidatus Methylomirabilia bacterium]